MASDSQAFTVFFDHIENILCSKVRIDNPYNPEIMPAPAFADEFEAVWDTGATSTVISRKVAQYLCLKPIGFREVHHGGGKDICQVFLVSMLLPHHIILPYMEIIESNLTSCDVLIGMDIINQGDFAVSNFQKRTTFTFRTPSLQHFDFLSR